MDHEERFSRIDRQLEFLAGNHAQLWADLQELQQISRRHSEQIEQNSAQIAEVGDFILRLGRIVEEQGCQHDRRIDDEAQQRKEETRRREEESRRFDERLNALIHIFERYFGNGGKDRPKPSH
jgi:chromosome segregation ATPase